MVSAEVGMKKVFVRTSVVGLASIFLAAGLSLATDPVPPPGAPAPATKRDPHHSHGKHDAAGGAKAGPAKGAPGKGASGKPTGAPAPMPYPGGLIERNAKRLGVDQATIKKMRETVDASKAENEKLRKQLEGEQVTLRKLMDQDVPDEAAVMAHADKVGALIAAQRKNSLRAVLKIRGMLTPAQRAELAKLRGR
jgi:Spy/CpxP family protein refolding chaperone